MTLQEQSARLADIDLNDLRFWARPLDQRAAAFALLREQEGPRFYPDPQVPFTKRGKGYWALVRHADVTEASRNPDIFGSEPNATSIVDSPRFLDRYINSMISMDDPRHAKIRRIVSRAFSPKMLAKTAGSPERSRRSCVVPRRSSTSAATSPATTR